MCCQIMSLIRSHNTPLKAETSVPSRNVKSHVPASVLGVRVCSQYVEYDSVQRQSEEPDELEQLLVDLRGYSLATTSPIQAQD